MTQAELYAALKTLKLPVTYGEFVGTPENPPPAPPFICYQFAYSGDLMADNKNAIELSNFQIELYTNVKDLANEKLVQDKLKELCLPYLKIEAWIEAERMWQILYEIQLTD